MSLELLEIGGLIAAAVALTAFFHRALQPRLARLAQGRLAPSGALGDEDAEGGSFGRNPLRPRPVSQSRLRSPA